MHRPRLITLGALTLSSGAASSVSACSGQQAPGAPVVAATPPARASSIEPAEPIAEYVVAAFTDSKGVLWFGTLGEGVARYDGEKLTYLSPAAGADNVVSSIAEDEQGTLWFAGHEGTGLCKYDGVSFTQIWRDETLVRADRRGRIWAGTPRGVLRRDGEGFAEFAVPLGDETAPAYAIGPGRVAMELEDRAGNLWFRSDGYGAIRYDGRSFTRFTARDGLCSDTVWSIVEDLQGRLWFTCIEASQPHKAGEGGVRRLDGDTFTAFPAVKGLTDNDIYTLHADRSGNLWIGATGVGVYRYDGDAFTLYDQTNRPDLNGRFGLQAITEDRRGVLWYGFSGGLFRLEDERFVHVSRQGPWE